MRLLLALAVSLTLMNTAQAQRVYNQAELDAMLAPIALQPDAVVTDVLVAASYPDEVAAATRWSRANPQLRGDDAVRAVHYEPWHPAVRSLVAFPELLQRMDESPQWLHDLGAAFRVQEPHVMATVQALRRRAQASGHLSSSEYQAVYDHGETIVVQPRTQYVYVPYYDPYVVYGAWWWPHYRPVFWRPWVARPVIATHVYHSKPHWHHKHPVHRPHVVHKPVTGKPHVRVPESQRKPIINQMPAATSFSHQRRPPEMRQHPAAKPHARFPESQAKPVVSSQMPAANGFSHQRFHPEARQRGEMPKRFTQHPRQRG